MSDISPQELENWLKDKKRKPPLLIDVRELWEFEICHIEGSLNISMSELPGQVDEFATETSMVLICHHGERSGNMVDFMQSNGFTAAKNLAGGLDAWAKIVDTTMSKY